MSKIIWEGILLGLLLACLIGPVFFMLIQTSILKGEKAGLSMALGISISDVLCIVLGATFFTSIENIPSRQFYISIIGGIMLIFFGFISLFKKKIATQEPKNQIPNSSLSFFQFALKGFIVNFLSPSVILFWLSTIGFAQIELQISGNKLFIFFASTLITVFLSDLLKIHLAKKISVFFTENHFLWLNRITGFALACFGTKMLLESC